MNNSTQMSQSEAAGELDALVVEIESWKWIKKVNEIVQKFATFMGMILVCGTYWKMTTIEKPDLTDIVTAILVFFGWWYIGGLRCNIWAEQEKKNIAFMNYVSVKFPGLLIKYPTLVQYFFPKRQFRTRPKHNWKKDLLELFLERTSVSPDGFFVLRKKNSPNPDSATQSSQ